MGVVLQAEAGREQEPYCRRVEAVSRRGEHAETSRRHLLTTSTLICTGCTSFMALGFASSTGHLLEASLDALVNFCCVNFLLLRWLLLLLRLRRRHNTKHSNDCKQFKHGRPLNWLGN